MAEFINLQFRSVASSAGAAGWRRQRKAVMRSRSMRSMLVRWQRVAATLTEFSPRLPSSLTGSKTNWRRDRDSWEGGGSKAAPGPGSIWPRLRPLELFPLARLTSATVGPPPRHHRSAASAVGASVAAGRAEQEALLASAPTHQRPPQSQKQICSADKFKKLERR